MVSPAPLAAANPPLSYAERAKKAQNQKPSSSSQPLQRSASQGTSSTTSLSPNSSTARPPTVQSPPASKPSPSDPADPRISSTAAHSIPVPSSKTPPSENYADSKPNGGANHHGGDSALSVPSIAPTPKQSAAPPVNVWSIRKERMAARALTQSRASQPPSSSTSTSQSLATASVSSPPQSSLDVSAPPSTSTSASINLSIKPSPSTAPPPTTNGHLVPPSDFDDPFVVKPGRSPPVSVLNPSPPPINDAESWPEVSQTVATPPNGTSGRVEGKKDDREEEERGHEREASQGHGSRKSEKTKWVPAPPEVLQFEGPARAQHARQRSHNQDRSNPRQAGAPSGGTSSSSGPGSQQQSRTHSVTGRRPTPSHAGSVSHSQTQSRTGSVHSSPRHSSIRGGRRLPDETSGPVFGTNRSIRSSGTNSPATYAQPQPLPVQEFIPGVRPYVNTVVTQSGARDPSALSAIPDSAAAAHTELNPHAAFYYPSGPQFGVSPYHSPRPAGSPANNPYPLPSMTYPGQPGMPPPVPISGYGTPPYPMYPSYGYPYGHPYMYWHPPSAPPPPAVSSSPLVNAQSSDGVPPPTMLARPPPPSESEAVAGYRDVGYVLPPPAEYSRHGQGEERGRRTREFSFGTIRAGLDGAGKSTSPKPASPGLDAVPEGAALGLDVSGGQHLPQPPAQVVGKSAQGQGEMDAKDQQKDEAKSFPGFYIGVGPGEPGPARLRSRTRTQSKGPANAVAAQGESAAQGQEGRPACTEAADPVVVLVDATANLVVDPETKWEFGTTKQAEGGAPEVESGSSVPPANDVAVVVDPSSSAPPGTMGVTFVPLAAQYPSVPPYVPPVTIPGVPVNGMPSGGPSPSAYGPPRQPLSAGEDEWEVRDYGYGFGRGGPGMYPQAAASLRDDRPFRGGRDYQGEREPHYGRPRRGSYSQGGYGYDRGGERGSYGGRRGRGLSGGYGGRGYQNRSFSGRGGYSNQGPQRQQAYVPQTQPQPEVNGYYAPPAAPMATYIPQAFEGYPYAPYPPPPPQMHTASPQGAPPPPVPMPQSNVGFPLDSTRYYLLGQLEYYLSPQNMAQDFYLRQQMDSRGWIPISLIASFNRVRTLTMDPQLVTDVLTLSSLVEVQGASVRPRQWQQFVLPTAAPSHVEEDDDLNAHLLDPIGPLHGVGGEGQHHIPHAPMQTLGQNHDGEDDEDEDVVFVL